jgi:hypothetical protein
MGATGRTQGGKPGRVWLFKGSFDQLPQAEGQAGLWLVSVFGWNCNCELTDLDRADYWVGIEDG